MTAGIERVVVASTGGEDFVSTQYRLGPVRRAGPWPFEVHSVAHSPQDADLAPIERAADARAVLVLQRVMPSPAQAARLRRAYAAVVFDFDDAVYAPAPDLGTPAVVAHAKRAARLVLRGHPDASARRRRLVRALGEVDLCVAGNAVLAGFARSHAPRTVVIPTTVSPVERPAALLDPPVVVWMGVPDNLQYLERIGDVLADVARTRPHRLRVVSAAPWRDPPVPVEWIPWDGATYGAALAGCTAGLAPLTDTAWTRGKCAFRAIQYGGHGVAAIASPVGITDEVVLHGRTGLLARSAGDWGAALTRLLDDPAEAAMMGAAALAHVRAGYSDEVAVGAWRAALEGAAGLRASR